MKKVTSIPCGNQPPLYLPTLHHGSQTQSVGLKTETHASKQPAQPCSQPLVCLEQIQPVLMFLPVCRYIESFTTHNQPKHGLTHKQAACKDYRPLVLMLLPIPYFSKLQTDDPYAMSFKPSRAHAITLSQLSTEAAIVNLPLPTRRAFGFQIHRVNVSGL